MWGRQRRASQPQTISQINSANALSRGLVAAAIPSTGQILGVGLHDKYGKPSGTSIKILSGLGGLGVDGRTSSTDAYRLNAAANQTNTVWERPVVAGSWAVVCVRYGNQANGNAPVFGNQSTATAPYSAWAIVDRNGTDQVSVECSAGGTVRVLDTSAAFGNNKITVIVGTYDGANLRCYKNGTLIGTLACTGNLTYPNNSDRGPAIGNFYNYTASARSFNGAVYLASLWERALTPTEVFAFASNPWQIVSAPARKLWLMGASGVTHTTSGAVSGAGATVAGTATHLTLHTTSGVATGGGATVAGAATHKTPHTTTGDVAGGGATVAGTAAHKTLHTTSGTVAGAGATVAGAATHPHTTTGAVTGGGATVAGASDHITPGGIHATIGDVAGGGATVTGTATHRTLHGTSGAAQGAGATVAGNATHLGTHTTSGDVSGAGAQVTGTAVHVGTDTGRSNYMRQLLIELYEREWKKDDPPEPIEVPVAVSPKRLVPQAASVAAKEVQPPVAKAVATAVIAKPAKRLTPRTVTATKPDIQVQRVISAANQAAQADLAYLSELFTTNAQQRRALEQEIEDEDLQLLAMAL